MSEEKNEYRKPDGVRSAETATFGGTSLTYTAEADWIVLREKEQPAAELFYVAYTAAEADASRPLTFVFNGGPGAASAYLHVGALGPRRVQFSDRGDTPPPPARLVDNAESWLRFTDLVFVDPVGTGFSRAVPRNGGKDGAGSEKEPEDRAKEFWKIERDLKSLGEFMSRYLSMRHRWGAPMFVAGESYGGFRAARLARIAQETYGIGLNGVILISPALEFTLLDGSDYDVLPWIDVLPSMTAAAAFHNRASAFAPGSRVEDILTAAEAMATDTAVKLLIAGDSIRPDRIRTLAGRIARHVGIERSIVESTRGRISPSRYSRELLRSEGLVCGLYDATVTAEDPYPDRETYGGPDPTLRSIERLFASGINSHVREHLGLVTERQYHLLSMEVNSGWQVDLERHALDSQIGATDDLRYGMSLNPAMRVRITHGIYDLVTPYFASNRIARLMRLSDRARANLSLKHYPGGHMFYAWDSSRATFARDIEAFYTEALATT